MKINVSNGELADKVSILFIKKENIKNEEKLKNVIKELDLLLPLLNTIPQTDELKKLFAELSLVNALLWFVEDQLREKEKKKEFDQEFIDLARSVYKTNDKRAELKKKINLLTNSELVEEKSYVQYEPSSNS